MNNNLQTADYTRPAEVTAPSARWQLTAVIRDGGSGGYSLALGQWDGERVLALRWNGSGDQPKGNPLSSTHPTWMVLPGAFNMATLATLWVERLRSHAGLVDAAALQQATEAFVPTVQGFMEQLKHMQALISRLPGRH